MGGKEENEPPQRRLLMSEFSPAESPFPPADLESFLRFCAGEWLAVRSRFALEAVGGATETGEGAEAGGAAEASEAVEETWHRSERGALVVTYLEAGGNGAVGGLQLTPPGSEAGDAAASRQIHFEEGGSFARLGPDGSPLGRGSWEMGPDGSLELTETGTWGVVRERIWFTKPNLRLRSSVQNGPNGEPGQASFSSEIRRVSRAAP